MNEQLPPQSVEAQIRALDGLFASSQNDGQYVIYSSPVQQDINRAMQEMMNHYVNTDVSFTSTDSNGQYTIQIPEPLPIGLEGQMLTVANGQPVWLKTGGEIPKAKKSFFERLTIVKDE